MLPAPAPQQQAAEFWEMGLEPHPVSAISGTGTGEMLDVLVAGLPPPARMESEDLTDASAKPLAIAIVGRPNVGECACLPWGGLGVGLDLARRRG